MENLFKNKYRILPTRLANWDYGANGLYYITICTANRTNYFGDIVSSGKEEEAGLEATEMGAIAERNWQNIPEHFDFVELDEYVVMPNHIHGILFFNKPQKTDWTPNRFGVQSGNLASVLRGFKASVKTYATTNSIEFSWQSRYHDHVIRNEKEYFSVAELSPY